MHRSHPSIQVDILWAKVAVVPAGFTMSNTRYNASQIAVCLCAVCLLPGCHPGADMGKLLSHTLPVDVKFRTGDDVAWASPEHDDTGWSVRRIPHLWKDDHIPYPADEFTRKGWYRIAFDRPAAEDMAQAQALYIGTVLSMTEVYFNGHRLGANMPIMQDQNTLYEHSYYTPSIYSIPDSIWRDGRQVIAIRQFQPLVSGGLLQYPIGIGPAVPLMEYRADMRGSELIVYYVNVALLAHWLMIFVFLVPQECRRPGFKATLAFLFFALNIWVFSYPGWDATIARPLEYVFGKIKIFSLAATIFCIPLMLYQLLGIPVRKRMALLTVVILLWFIPGHLLFGVVPPILTRFSISVFFSLSLLLCCVLCVEACWHSFRSRKLDAICLGMGIAGILVFSGYDFAQIVLPFLSLINAWDVPIGRPGDLISFTLIGHFIFVNALGLVLLYRFQEKQNTIHGLSDKVITAESAERYRLSLELHDGISQSLEVLKLQSELVCDDFKGNSELAQKLGSITQGIRNAIIELRQAAGHMRPIWLQSGRFEVGLRRFVDDLRSRTEKDITLDIMGEITMTPLAENHLFRIIQEATQNALKHSGSKHITLTLSQKSDQVRFRCRDDGRGFTVGQAETQPTFRSLRERTDMLQGTCSVSSEAGRGTDVDIAFRC